MKTTARDPAAVPAEDAPFSGLFLWLAHLPCCDGWGLFHASVEYGGLDPEPEAVLPPADEESRH